MRADAESDTRVLRVLQERQQEVQAQSTIGGSLVTRRDTQADLSEVILLPDASEAHRVDLSRDPGSSHIPIDGITAYSVGSSALRRYRMVAVLLIVIDAACLAIALLIAHFVRFGDLPGMDYIAGMFVAAAVWVGVFHALGLYTPQHLSGLEEFRGTVAAVGIGVVLVILVTFWLDVYVSRSWAAITIGIVLVLELAARWVVRLYLRRLRASDSLRLRTLVIGNHDDTHEPIQALGKRGSGYLPLGYIDATHPVLSAADVPMKDRVNRLRFIFRQYRLDCIFMASPTIGHQQMLAVMQAARLERVLVRIYTHLSGVWASRLTAQTFGKEGVALTIKPAGLSTSQRAIKRGMDVVLASLGAIVMSPVFLFAALAVRTTSAGPVLFRQQRVTEGARTFVMYKFRTMTDGAGDIEDEHGIDTSAPFFKIKTDPRLTKVGKFLRRWSIDELPQLFNVLMGDMSLVGPRPLPAEQVSANIELLGPRHEVRAGMTGWWQIQGRSDVDPEQAIRMDHFYIENWSPTLDVYILLKTAGALLSHKGAY